MRRATVAFVLSLLALGGFLSGIAMNVSAATPAGIVYSVPVVLSNSAQQPTPVPFQQMVVVNSSRFASYESAYLYNVEFLYSNGTVIPSWLESGNSYESQTTIYWLKLLSQIPAGGTLTVYLGFGAPSARLMDGKTVGEAPQLSVPYGSLDSGRAVFGFYDNFAGTALNGSSWETANATATVSDGLEVSLSPPGGYVVSAGRFGPGTAFDGYVTSVGDVDNIGYVNPGEPLPSAQGSYAGAFVRLACGNTYPDQWNSNGEANGCGGADGSLLSTEGSAGVYSVHVLSATSSEQYFDCGTGGSRQPIANDPPGYPSGVGIEGVNPASLQWARVRNLPPSNSMPAVTVNGVPSDEGVSCTGAGAKPHGDLTISVTPATGTQILVDGNVVASDTSLFTFAGLPFGVHNVVAYNPSYLYNSTEVDLESAHASVSLSLERGTGVPGEYSPWEPIGPYKLLLGPPMIPPSGSDQANSGHLGTMAIDDSNPNVMYVATGSSADPTYGPYGDAGIFKTTDGGKTWTPANYGLPLDPVSSLLMNQTNPEELLAGFWSAGVYRTTDGGGYWYRVADYPFVTGLTAVNGSVFAGTGGYFTGGGGSVVKGTGFGTEWSTVLTTSVEVTAISASGPYVYAAGGDLWRSKDLGASWTQIKSPSNDVVEVSASPANPQSLYVLCGNAAFASSGVEPDGAYYSGDGGATFAPVPALSGYRVIDFDPSNASVIWTQGSYTARISFDGGASWANPYQTAVGSPVGDLHNLYFVPTEDGAIYALSDQGVFRTADFGADWQSANGNLFDFLVYGFGISGDGTQIVASMQDYGAPQTRDGGETWSFGNLSGAYGIPEGAIVYTNPADPSWVYAFNPGDNALAESDNGGLNFNVVLTVPGSAGPTATSNSLFAVDPSDGSLVYFGSPAGVYLGSDFGLRWSLLAGSPGDVSSVWVAPAGTLFVSNSTRLYRYSAGRWSESGGVSFPVGSMAFDPRSPGTVLLAPGGGAPATLYLSEDGGASFRSLSSDPFRFPFTPPPPMGYASTRVNLLFLNTTGDPLVAATTEGVYLSTNVGESWTPISYNLLSGQATWLAYTDQNLYLSTFGEGIVEMKDFSLGTLPATLNGVAEPGVDSVTVNGSAVGIFDGHFQEFLKPGDYQVSVSSPIGSQTYSLSLSPMQVYNFTASVSGTATSTTATSVSSTGATSTTTSTSGSASTKTAGGGGILEFPYQAVVAAVFTGALVVSYLLHRRGLRPSGSAPRTVS